MDKNFADFKKTLTEDEFIKISEKVNKKNLQIKFSETPEGINDLMQKSIIANTFFTLELLERYHNWLQS